MKKVLFVAFVAAIVIADCYGTQRFTPGYGAVLNNARYAEAKNLAHGMGYEINNLSQEMSRIQVSTSNASLSDKFREAFPNTGNSEQKNPLYALQVFLRSLGEKHIGLAPILVNAVGGGDASKYGSLGTINSLQSFEAKCDEYKGDAGKIKLLFAYMAETVEIKSIGNIFEINPNYDAKNPGIEQPYKITTPGTASGFSVSNGYNDLAEAIQLLAYGKRLTISSFQYNSTFKDGAAPTQPTFVQNIVQNDLKLSDTDPGDLYRNVEKQSLSFRLEYVDGIFGSISCQVQSAYLSNNNVKYLMFANYVCFRGSNQSYYPLEIYTTSTSAPELSRYDIGITVYQGSNQWASIGKYIVCPYNDGEGFDLLTINGEDKLVLDSSNAPAGFSTRAKNKCPGVISQGDHHYLVYAGGEAADDNRALKSIEVYKIDNVTGNLIKKSGYNDDSFNLTGQELRYGSISTTITDGKKSFLIFHRDQAHIFDIYSINDSGNLFKVTAATNGGHAIELNGENHGWEFNAIGKYCIFTYAEYNWDTKVRTSEAITYMISDGGYLVPAPAIEDLPFDVTSWLFKKTYGDTIITDNQRTIVFFSENQDGYNQACGYLIDENSRNFVPIKISGTFYSGSVYAGFIGDYIVAIGGDADGERAAFKLASTPLPRVDGLFRVEQVDISGGSANYYCGEGVYLSNGDINCLMFPNSEYSLQGTNPNNGTLSVYTTSKNSPELRVCNLDIPIYYGNGTTTALISIGKYIVFPYKNGTALDLLTIDDSTGKLIKVTDQSKIPAGFERVGAWATRSGVISQGNYAYLMFVGGYGMPSNPMEIYQYDKATEALVRKTNEYKNAEFSLTYSFYNSSQTITNGTKSFLIFTESNNQGFDVYGINDSGNLYKVTAATNGGHAIECNAMPNGCVSGAVGKYFALLDKGAYADDGIYQIGNMNVYTISNDGYFVKDSSIQLPFAKCNYDIELCTTSIAGDPCLVILYSTNRGAYKLCGYMIDKNSGKLTATTIGGMITSSVYNISSIGDYMVADGQQEAYKLVPNE